MWLCPIQHSSFNIQHYSLISTWLSAFAVTLDVGFGEAFHAHHLEHHGEVEVDVEQVLFPLDADDRRGVELKVFDFDFFHRIFFGYWLLATGYWLLAIGSFMTSRKRILFCVAAKGQEPEARGD